VQVRRFPVNNNIDGITPEIRSEAKMQWMVQISHQMNQVSQSVCSFSLGPR
jgi:hypothetical protein